MTRRRGFTLIELIATIVVLSAVAGVISGIVSSASGAYASAAETRAEAEDLSLAMDLIAHTLREAPESETTPGETSLATAAAGRFALDDGAGVRRDADTLIYTTSAGEEGVLCTGVTRFELVYLDAAGAPGAPGRGTRAVRVHLEGERIELATTVFLRMWLEVE